MSATGSAFLARRRVRVAVSFRLQLIRLSFFLNPCDLYQSSCTVAADELVARHRAALCLDLVMNEDVRDTFEKRFKIISAVRRYMEDQQFYEVETPFLHPILGGANAKSLRNALQCA